MTWNAEKWAQFINANKSQKHVYDTKHVEILKEEMQQSHIEDVDTTAPGIQRVKEYLNKTRDEIEASGEVDGAHGPDGPALPNNPIVVAHADLTTTSQDIAAPIDLDYNVSAGELDETKSIVLISCYQYGLSDIEVWVYGVGAPVRIFTFGGLLVNDGHVDIWISPLIGWFDVGTYIRAVTNAMGVASMASTTSVASHWMSSAITIQVRLYSANPPLAKWGGNVTIFKVTSPTFVSE